MLALSSSVCLHSATRLALQQNEQENQYNPSWMKIGWYWKISVTTKKHVYSITVNIQFLGKATALPSSTTSQHPLVKLIITALSLPGMGSAYCICNLHGFGRTWWDAHNEMKCFFLLWYHRSSLESKYVLCLGFGQSKGAALGWFLFLIHQLVYQQKSSAGLIHSASCPHCFSTAWSSKYQQGHILFSSVLSHRGVGVGKEQPFVWVTSEGHANGCSWMWTFYGEICSACHQHDSQIGLWTCGWATSLFSGIWQDEDLYPLCMEKKNLVTDHLH